MSKVIKVKREQLSRFDDLNVLLPNNRYSCNVVARCGENAILNIPIKNSLTLISWEKGSETLQMRVIDRFME